MVEDRSKIELDRELMGLAGVEKGRLPVSGYIASGGGPVWDDTA
jgi:hypothetical protein